MFPSPEPADWSLKHTSLKHRGDSKLRTASLGETLLFYPLQATGPCWFQQVPVLDSSQTSQFQPGEPVAAFLSPSSFPSLSCCSAPSFPRLAGEGGTVQLPFLQTATLLTFCITFVPEDQLLIYLPPNLFLPSVPSTRVRQPS